MENLYDSRARLLNFRAPSEPSVLAAEEQDPMGKSIVECNELCRKQLQSEGWVFTRGNWYLFDTSLGRWRRAKRTDKWRVTAEAVGEGKAGGSAIDAALAEQEEEFEVEWRDAREPGILIEGKYHIFSMREGRMKIVDPAPEWGVLDEAPYSLMRSHVDDHFDDAMRVWLSRSPDAFSFLQEFLGAILFRSTSHPNLQLSVLLYSKGQTGKSTFGEIVMKMVRAVYGRDSVATVPPRHFGRTFDLFNFGDIIFNFCSDTGDPFFPDGADGTSARDHFKQVVTGDALHVQAKGKNAKVIYPRVGILNCTNSHSPRMGEATFGMQRRFEFIEWAHVEDIVRSNEFETYCREFPAALFRFAYEGAKRLAEARAYSKRNEVRTESMFAASDLFSQWVRQDSRKPYQKDDLGMSLTAAILEYTRFCRFELQGRDPKIPSRTKFKGRLIEVGKLLESKEKEKNLWVLNHDQEKTRDRYRVCLNPIEDFEV